MSRRTDGHPAGISASLDALNFTNPAGYEVTVSKPINLISIDSILNFFQDLYTNQVKYYRLKHGIQFEERVNPTGKIF